MHRWVALLWVACSLSATANDRYEQMARDLLAELIEIDTSHPRGDNTRAAQLVADRLLAAGFPREDVHVIVPAPRKGNVVARLRAKNPTREPILLLAHIDVVTANPEDWTLPPFEFIERDGIFYGRGVVDDKDEAAIHATNLIRWKEEGFETNRDIIMALTADEEGGPVNGVQHLLAEHRHLIDAEFVINEGGGGVMVNGMRMVNNVQAAEKVYQSFTLTVLNPGGHSSVPRKDNAIYQLARALVAIENYRFPVQLNEVSRAFFRGALPTLRPDHGEAVEELLRSPDDGSVVDSLAELPYYNARLRTTCVATELLAGHAENALPQRAQATVNCRMLPGTPMEAVRDALIGVMGDPQVSIEPVQAARPSPPSPLTEEVMDPIYQITQEMWPGVRVLPAMSTGATDGLYFRQAGIPVYGTSGIFTERTGSGAHGQNERLHAKSFYEGLEYLNRLVKAYASD